MKSITIDGSNVIFDSPLASKVERVLAPDEALKLLDKFYAEAREKIEVDAKPGEA